MCIRDSFQTALDDFGSGHANLEWLAQLSPHAIKLDMCLVREIHTNKRKQAIVTHLTNLCRELGVDILAEGVETRDERDCLATIGIVKQQGFYFAKPQFETFTDVDITLMR